MRIKQRETAEVRGVIRVREIFSPYTPSTLSSISTAYTHFGKKCSPWLKKFSLLCCCLLLLVGCQSQHVPIGTTVTVQVQRVVSGQTLDVLNPNQQPAVIERVRLIGIESPDLKQEPWGTAAKNRFEQMISQTNGQQLILQPVFLEPDTQVKDSFGRYLAYVWQDGRLINEELVKEGYALAAPRSPNNKYDERIARAQEYARIMGYGIWNSDQPMRLTPAEFRRQNP